MRRSSIMTSPLIWVALALALGDPAEAAGRSVEGGGIRSGGPARAPALIDNTARMDANNLDMVVTNHGSFAFDLLTGNAGLIYPKGTTKTAVFAAGLWIGAQVGGQVRVALGEYSQEYVPGPMLNGTFLPDRPEFKTYRIEAGGVGYADYLANAVPQGAPVDAQGNPLLLGAVTLWSVFNDADPAAHTSDVGRTAPLGVEVQQTIYAFDRAGPLGSTIFLRWKLLNKGLNALENAYVSIWSDPDVGDASDDLVGCDTTLALGYCYNATDLDGVYGTTPPAAGFTLLRGPVIQRSPGVYDTLGLAAFGKYINGTDPVSALESYNYMRGLDRDGAPIHEFDNPLAPITTYVMTGDPVTGTGWLDANEADRRMQLSVGPFTMTPGDSQEVIAAVLIGQGADRLSSITDVRSIAGTVRALPSEPPASLSVSAPSSRSVDEGQPLDFEVTSRDPDGTATLGASNLPLGAAFTDLGDGTGSFQWTPDYSQAGSYAVTFTAHGTTGATASATTAITVRDVNRKPAADAGGPYAGFAGTPLAFDGTGSLDPDGSALSYLWDFGDDETGVGPTPSHAYAFRGLYGVALTVSDGALTDIGTTTADIVDQLPARAFTASGNRTIRLGSGKPQWCVQIEPVGRSFDINLVGPATLLMKSPGTGSVDQIHAVTGKPLLVGDRDGNGVDELTACFDKEDLRLLFSGLEGSRSVPVSFEGRVLIGGEFRAALDVAVIPSGGSLAASVDPNPASAAGTLRFITRSPGRVTVSVFDISGRLVRRISDLAAAAAGARAVRLDGLDEGGRALGAGIYFYRVDTAEGTAEGRFVLLK